MDLTRAKIAVFLGRHKGPNSGLWVYGCGLVGAFASRGAILGGVRLAYAGPPELRYELESVSKTAKGDCFALVELPSTVLGRRFGSFLDLFSSAVCGTDIAHGTANTIPLCGGRKRVLSLHDLLQAYPPKASAIGVYSLVKHLFYRLKFALLLRSVDLVLVDHASTRDQILKFFRTEARIEIVYPGLAKDFTSAPIPHVLNQSKSFLAFASLDPRKNVEGVLYAFKTFTESVGSEFQLNLVVNDELIVDDMRKQAEGLGILPSCKIQLNLSTAELINLYSNSRACLFPSLAEGYGYPIYEALSQGIPVVCDINLVVPEIFSELSSALVNCDPRDKLSIYSGLRQVVEIEQDQGWRERVARTVREKLSVERCAEAVLRLYQEIL